MKRNRFTGKEKHFIGSITMGFIVSILIMFIGTIYDVGAMLICFNLAVYWSIYGPISALLYWIHFMNKFVKETDTVVNQLLKELKCVNDIILLITENKEEKDVQHSDG